MENLGVVEVTDREGILVIWYVTHDDTFLYYGGACNVGHLCQGRFKKDSCFSLDENLQALVEMLETL